MRQPLEATWRKCLVCGVMLERREGERPNKWHQRQTCSDECKRIRIGLIQRGDLKCIEPRDWTKPLAPWPDGVAFDSLPLSSEGVIRLSRSETHRPYGTSASWAVGGEG